jgi:catalase
VSNNQRDGMHRQAIHRGRVAYEPNSLGGGCPFQAGLSGGGFTSFPDRMSEPDKVRGKPELFADHYSQAGLFFRSQTPTEQAHIVAAFRFELSRVQTQAVRERVVSMLANADSALARGVAMGLGIAVPPPMPKVLDVAEPEYPPSAPLSLTARPGDGSVKAMRVALMVAPGVDRGVLQSLYAELVAAGAVPRYVGPHLGAWQAASDEPVHVDTSFEAMPAVLFDALVIPDGEAAVEHLAGLGQALDFVREQYRHCKPILVIGAGERLLERAGVPKMLPGGSPDPGLVFARSGTGLGTFRSALARRRHYERETDPPGV